MITNKIFMQESKEFRKACKKANIKITKRQASKFRIGKGIAMAVLFDRMKPLEKGHPGFFEYN